MRHGPRFGPDQRVGLGCFCDQDRIRCLIQYQSNHAISYRILSYHLSSYQPNQPSPGWPQGPSPAFQTSTPSSSAADQSSQVMRMDATRRLRRNRPPQRRRSHSHSFVPISSHVSLKCAADWTQPPNSDRTSEKKAGEDPAVAYGDGSYSSSGMSP